MTNGQVNRAYPEVAGTIDGVGSRQLILLDAQSGGTSPGYWMPWAPFHKGSFEVTGTFVGTVNMLISNAKDQPFNSYELTIGGTVHTGDIITVVVNSFAFLNGKVTVVYTVLSTDTTLAILTTSLIAAIDAAITAQANMVALGRSVNLAASQIGAVAGTTTTTINVQWTYPFPPLTVTAAVTGAGATTTIASAPFDDGGGFAVTACTVTAPGNVQFDAIGTWIKADISAYSSDTGGITAIVQTSIP
jgi:hypothetical protein